MQLIRTLCCYCFGLILIHNLLQSEIAFACKDCHPVCYCGFAGGAVSGSLAAYYASPTLVACASRSGDYCCALTFAGLGTFNAGSIPGIIVGMAFGQAIYDTYRKCLSDRALASKVHPKTPSNAAGNLARVTHCTTSDMNSSATTISQVIPRMERIRIWEAQVPFRNVDAGSGGMPISSVSMGEVQNPTPNDVLGPPPAYPVSYDLPPPLVTSAPYQSFYETTVKGSQDIPLDESGCERFQY